MPGNLTAHQAEQALGRPLTWLEQEWVTKTLGWKDYELYCLTFFILVIGYCVGSAPFLTLDFLRIPFFEKYRLQPTYRNSYSAVVDCLRSVLGDMFMVILPLNLTSFPFFSVAGINGGIPLPTLPEMALQLATFFIVEDFGNYWIHRWLHTEWAYKRIHWKHHEFTTPMSFAASYAHPLEILILGVPSFVGPAIVRCHVITLWAWIVLRQWEAVETHSGYHFPWSPTRLIPFYGGAEYHDYHHFVGGKSRGNFASVFTWCDYIYGTDKGYRYRKDFELRQAAAKAEARAAAGLGYSVLTNGSPSGGDVAKTS